MINKRIQRLRQESLEAVNRISPERAILLTEFYGKPDTNDLPIVIQRAASFRYLM